MKNEGYLIKRINELNIEYDDIITKLNRLNSDVSILTSRKLKIEGSIEELNNIINYIEDKN